MGVMPGWVERRAFACAILLRKPGRVEAEIKKVRVCGEVVWNPLLTRG